MQNYSMQQGGGYQQYSNNRYDFSEFFEVILDPQDPNFLKDIPSEALLYLPINKEMRVICLIDKYQKDLFYLFPLNDKSAKIMETTLFPIILQDGSFARGPLYHLIPDNHPLKSSYKNYFSQLLNGKQLRVIFLRNIRDNPRSHSPCLYFKKALFPNVDFQNKNSREGSKYQNRINCVQQNKNIQQEVRSNQQYNRSIKNQQSQSTQQMLQNNSNIIYQANQNVNSNIQNYNGRINYHQQQYQDNQMIDENEQINNYQQFKNFNQEGMNQNQVQSLLQNQSFYFSGLTQPIKLQQQNRYQNDGGMNQQQSYYNQQNNNMGQQNIFNNNQQQQNGYYQNTNQNIFNSNNNNNMQNQSNNQNIFNNQYQQNGQNIFTNQQSNQNIFNNNNNMNNMNRSGANIFQNQNNQTPNQNIFQNNNNNSNIFNNQGNNMQQNNIFNNNNNSTNNMNRSNNFVNPIIQSRMNRQTNNPVGGGNQGNNIFNNNMNNQNNQNIFSNNNSNIFNNNNTNNNMNRNNNPNIFSNNQNSGNINLFNQNNNGGNQNIFNNNSNNNNQGLFNNNSKIIFNNKPNNSGNIFNNNSILNNPNQSIFSGNNQTIFNNSNSIFTPDVQRVGNVNIYKNGQPGLYNQNYSIFNPTNQYQTLNRNIIQQNSSIPFENNKVYIPLPKKYQKLLTNDQFIDPNKQVGGYLYLLEDGKVIKLDRECMSKVNGALHLNKNIDRDDYLSRNGLIEEQYGIKIDKLSGGSGILKSNSKSKIGTASPLGNLDMNLSRAGISINNLKRGRTMNGSFLTLNSEQNKYFAKDDKSLNRQISIDRTSFNQNLEDETTADLHDTQNSEKEGWRDLMIRQNQFYSQKPMTELKEFISDNRFKQQTVSSFLNGAKPIGILKKSSQGRSNNSIDDIQQSNSARRQKSIDNLNNSFQNIEDERRKNKQIQQIFPHLSNQNKYWNELSKQNLYRQSDIIHGKKKYKFIYEMENDPNHEMYWPRRQQKIMDSIHRRKLDVEESSISEQQKRNSPSTNDNSNLIREFNTTENQHQEELERIKSSKIQTKYECTEDNPLGLMPLDKLAQLIKEDDEEEIEKEKDKKKGFFGFSFFSSTTQKGELKMDINCHITNISSQKSEEIEKQSQVKINTNETIKVFVENYFKKHCVRTGLIWHNDFDELFSTSVTAVDQKSNAIALTPLSKSFKDFKLSQYNKFIIEFFTSEAPTFKNKNYQCSPSINELISWPIEELQKVSQFTLINEHGSIYFENPVDLTRQNLDDIIIIEQKMAYVYPDHLFSGKCPKPGFKLNQQALVTLNCIDEKSFEKHKEGTLDYDKLERKLKNLCQKNNCEFVQFDRINYQFLFRVFDWSC